MCLNNALYTFLKSSPDMSLKDNALGTEATEATEGSDVN